MISWGVEREANFVVLIAKGRGGIAGLERVDFPSCMLIEAIAESIEDECFYYDGQRHSGLWTTSQQRWTLEKRCFVTH